MEPLRQNNFEKEWQKAFENASISPPTDMWDKIERELEHKKRRPFLFILRPSAIASGVAAALVLVLGGLFFLNKNTGNISVQNLSKTNSTPESTVAKVNPSDKKIINELPNSSEIISTNEALASVEKPIQVATDFNSKNQNKLSHFSNKLKFQHKNNNVEKPMSMAMAKADLPKDNTNDLNSVEEIQSVDNQHIISRNETILAENYRNLPTEMNTLKGKDYTYFGSSKTLKRNKLVFDYEVSEAPIIASNESKYWVGIQSGVSPFDPNMKLGGLNTFALEAADAFAKASNSPTTPNMGAVAGQTPGNVVVSHPQNAIKAGVGTNTGFAFGYKVAQKWNIESGIRYLRGNSTLQSNTYAFQQNGYVNTFLADYLLQNSSNNKTVLAQNPINTVVADASQFNNRYEYLMIPMQLGYEIGLSKKLGLNILAGISTDIFLQNTIANDNTFVQEKSTINSANNIYKPLNVSGLGGVRASYLLSKHWQVNIGSSYQHSLFSGINSSTALQMRIRMLGVNYGLNYRF
ncbi:outer membrane beta-barrel protein [Emticicia sp. SJ17W-69]|uniref:outer membrane beta-barrel protein n=1 Tax=Emticicia sp. SJ17W-69 TaxID=3421657 RepID=UPI003EC0E991